MKDKFYKEKEDFYRDNQLRIYEEYLKNKDKTGFLRFYVDADFNIIEKTLKFIEGDFDTSEFINQNNEIVADSEFIDIEAINIYYKIYWEANKTILQAKEVLVRGEFK